MRIQHDTYTRLLTILLCLFSLQFLPLSAHARLTGEAELGYVKYDATVDGAKVVDANSFKQRYSLLYSNSGALAGGRVGGYTYSLGYEWGSIDTKMKSSLPGGGLSISQNRGHFLFEGEVLLDPKELPLTFHAYSRDLNRMQFQDYQNLINLSADNGQIGDIVRPDMATDILNGQRIYSGATLLLGVRNGMTNGYNEIFRHLPMLMLDYKDEVIHDVKSLTPTDTRLSRFAFVSLNKKDNWFHFRSTRYNDYINPLNNWKEKAFQIGTVDQNLQRKWVDFTNWIKLSTDGIWTKRDAEIFYNTTERYDVNLFAIATRQTWEARSFNTFSRWTEGQSLFYDANAPLYVTGTWGAETDWRFRVSDREQKQMTNAGVWEKTSDILSSLQVTTFKRSAFTLTPSASVEHYDATTSGKTLALEGAVETTSTRRFSSRYQLFGRYDVKYFTTERNAESSTYLTQELDGRFAYTPSPVWSLELEQRFQMASGTNPGMSGTAVVVNSDFNRNSGNSIYWRGNGLSINDYTRSVTTVTGGWRPLDRLSLSLYVSEDVLMTSGQETNYITSVGNNISYSVAAFTLSANNRYQQQNGAKGSNNDMSSYVRATYKPDRTMDGSLNFNYERQTIDDSTSTFIDLTQKFNYYFYRVNGINRKLLEINEQIDYLESNNRYANSSLLIPGVMTGTVTVSTANTTTKRFTLGARYYPLQRLYLAASGQYYLIDPDSIKGQIYTGSIGFTASKFQVSLDYSYGTQQNSLKRVEQRFAANMKKFF